MRILKKDIIVIMGDLHAIIEVLFEVFSLLNPNYPLTKGRFKPLKTGGHSSGEYVWRGAGFVRFNTGLKFIKATPHNA
ncbi:MAG: hypothetical protein GX111_08250 [Clostridiales bacterium]|nr:hypothetical protein [Clostridiales bacterium]